MISLRVRTVLTFILFFSLSSCERSYDSTLDELGRLESKGKYAEALQLINELIQDFPGDDELKVNRAEYLYYLKDFKAAIRDLDGVLLNNPSHDYARYDRALCYVELRNFREAFRDLERLQMTRGIGSVQVNWGDADAIQRESYDLDLNEIRFVHGRVCFELDLYQLSINDFTSCIESNYGRAEAYYWRAFSHLKLGDMVNACRDLREMEALNCSELFELLAECDIKKLVDCSGSEMKVEVEEKESRNDTIYYLMGY